MLIVQQFNLYDFDWNVEVIYVVDKIIIDYIINELEELGYKEEEIQSAIKNLEDNNKNKGITFSNNITKNSIIVIGATSCAAEFQNSFDHEKLHLAIHIAKEFNIDPFGEDLAYLVGDIGMKMFPVAKRFLCDHCREKL